MKYVFFGGRESKFAQIILDGLIEAHQPPLAAYRNAKENIDLKKLKSLGADFFLVAAFGKILKKDLLEIPAKGTIGVHPSLLPRLRGASPIQSAILNDEKETGTTLFLIDEKVDHGPILANSNLPLMAGDNYISLEEKLAKISAELILKNLPKWLSNEIQPKVQNESEATYTKKFVNEDAGADLEKDNLKKIWLKIRALNPEPGTYAILKLKTGKELRLKLLEADFENGNLKLLKVQPEGKKPMPYKDFLNGYQKLLK